jgi:PAS domain S-box-containing protein
MRADDCPVIETPDLLLAVLERANDGVVIVDSDLHVSHFNAAAELLWQLDRTEVLGHHVSRLGLQDLGLKDLEPQHVATAASGQLNGSDATQPFGPEIRIQRKDGSRIRAALSLARVEAGGQSRTVAFVRDVTAEADLRERVALLSMIADGTSRAVVVTDNKLRVVYTNAAFTGMLGYSLEEAKGRPANELLVGRHPTAGRWPGYGA